MVARTSSRATLESVAARAAVSRQTVSNVLNAPHLVREATRQRVYDAIADLRYQPHAGARALRTRRSRVMALRLEPLHDGINGAVLDRFLHAFTEEAHAAGYRIELFTGGDDASEIEQYEHMLDSADVDGFVLTSTHQGDQRTRWLIDHDVPFVTFGRPWGAPPDLDHPWVDVDGAAGTRAAVSHLRSAGHEHIGFLGWPKGSGVGDDRRSGWLAALLDEGVSRRRLKALDVEVEDGVNQGAAAMRSLLFMKAPPTAVVCASDSLALGALAGSTAVGATLAIVGFDDTPVASAVGLSSLTQPLRQVAQQAFALLVYRLEQPAGGPPPDPHRLLAPELVVRGNNSIPPRLIPLVNDSSPTAGPPSAARATKRSTA